MDLHHSRGRDPGRASCHMPTGGETSSLTRAARASGTRPTSSEAGWSRSTWTCQRPDSAASRLRRSATLVVLCTTTATARRRGRSALGDHRARDRRVRRRRRPSRGSVEQLLALTRANPAASSDAPGATLARASPWRWTHRAARSSSSRRHHRRTACRLERVPRILAAGCGRQLACWIDTI